MHTKTILLCLVPFGLTACGDGTNPFDPDALTTSATFVTPAANGTFDGDLINRRGASVIDATGAGYAYQVGTNATNTGLVARAGIVPGTNLPAAPTTGTATMTGAYQVQTITNGAIETGVVTGDNSFATSTIALTANFDDMTLTNTVGALIITGDFSTGALAGTATFDGISGSLFGEVGADQAVGVFQGATATSVMAGGFNVTR